MNEFGLINKIKGKKREWEREIESFIVKQFASSKALKVQPHSYNIPNISIYLVYLLNWVYGNLFL